MYCMPNAHDNDACTAPDDVPYRATMTQLLATLGRLNQTDELVGSGIRSDLSDIGDVSCLEHGR